MSAARLEEGSRAYTFRGATQYFARYFLCAWMVLFTCNCNAAVNPLPAVQTLHSAQIQPQPAEQGDVQPLKTDCSMDKRASRSLVEGQFYLAPTVELKKPEKGVRYVDPAHGTCVVRVTDHFDEEPVGFARNDYSRRQAFNSDNSLILVHAHDGYWHLYNADDLSYIRKLDMSGSEVEPQWDPDNPSHLYLLEHNGGMTIRWYDVHTDSAKVVADFTRLDAIAG